MTTEQKQEIRDLLKEFVETFNSQKQAVGYLTEVSEATVINILAGRFDGISDSMFRNVGKQVGWNESKMQLVETLDFRTMILYFDIAKQHGETFALIGPEGTGKSVTGKWYRDNMKGKSVYHLRCNIHYNKKYFLQELLKAMGRDGAGMNVYEMVNDIVNFLRKQDHPLIILDEVDKLSDEVLFFFITLYNELHGLCGIVWTSHTSIKKRFMRGIGLNKRGYAEIFSRLGKKWIELQGTDKKEVRDICMVNGIQSEEDISRVYNEYQGDLRRVQRNYIKKVAQHTKSTLLKAS